MPAQVKTYTPSDIKVMIDNSYQIGGIVSISASFPKEKFKTINGIKGQNARVRNLDTSCILSIELLQTSTANDVLSSILTQDIATGRGRIKLSISDISGTTRIESEDAFINNYSEVRLSNDLSTKTWQITMLRTSTIVVGGNATNRPKFLEDAANFLSGAINSATSAISGIF